MIHLGIQQQERQVQELEQMRDGQEDIVQRVREQLRL